MLQTNTGEEGEEGINHKKYLHTLKRVTEIRRE